MATTADSSKESFQQQVFSLLAKHTVNNRTIALHSAILKFAGNLNCGVFLSQLIFWCDKGKSPDGYIYKTYKEWMDEICLSEYALRKAANKFKDLGILDIKVRKANGSPTVHYKLNRQAFIDAFLEFLEMESKKTKNGTIKKEDSLTEITAEISSEITKKHKGAKSKDVRSMCFSFKELTEKYNVDVEKAEGISYYMTMYRYRMGKEHPRLTKEQWAGIIDGLFECTDPDLDTYHEIDLAELQDMIGQHFKTEYRDCDYNILHFVSDRVKVRRMYEVAY